MRKGRKIPQRTCIGCRAVRPKRDLIRVVRTPEGAIHLDPTGKQSGRGAYLCPSAACVELAFQRKQLERALQITIASDTLEELRSELEAYHESP
ncbi:MAG: YlxR family protein [Firmicutes bacterium]|nr:YlxR family protein [Bacillota bacterium]